MRIKGGVTSCKLLLALAMIMAFSFAHRVKAERKVDAGPTYVREPASVPDAGSTLPLLGSALLAVVVLRRKLRC